MLSSSFRKLKLYWVLTIFAILGGLASCSDDYSSSEEATDQIDHDMITAEALAESYLTKSGARIENTSSTTVIRFSNNLTYKTNTQASNRYSSIGEQTVTAETNPGSNIFWYAGQGVKEIIGIEFDAASKKLLQSQPKLVENGNMWTIYIRPDINALSTQAVVLKYDIIYIPEGPSNQVIRLDPKLKINQK